MTIQLLVANENTDQGVSDQTRFGGEPGVPPGFAWPFCKTCNGNMQFLGQLQVADSNNRDRSRLLLLFMCQNEPGACNEWDANEGGNAVIPVLPENLAMATVPSGGATLVAFDSLDYESARAEWPAKNGSSPRNVLGQIGGQPSWVQGDETPLCNNCVQPMRFVAQLEQGPDWQTEMNFGGGGCAYVFDCGCSDSSAKMLWQC